MVTPGGYVMSVAMANCGALGWVTDKTGYRYDRIDPETGAAWPPMPESFRCLATTAAASAGFDGFAPDACLINRYQPGAKLSLHQDKDERDFTAPIVSVSLGLPATFLFGGDKRADKAIKIPLEHGDGNGVTGGTTVADVQPKASGIPTDPLGIADAMGRPFSAAFIIASVICSPA